MMKAERQELILKRVADSGRVVVTDLAKEMGVTETTLRKDLQELDDRGAVQRVHGGAIKPDTELSRFENRVDLGADVKKRLAELAMDEICENRVIFIDGGSTNYLAAQAFPRDWEGTVITNSPAVALWMSDYDHVEVNMLPGTINHKSKETVGSAALTRDHQGRRQGHEPHHTGEIRPHLHLSNRRLQRAGRHRDRRHAGLRRRARRHGRGRAHRQAVATPFPETARWAKDDSPHPWPVAPKTRPTTHSSFSRTPKEHQ